MSCGKVGIHFWSGLIYNYFNSNKVCCMHRYLVETRPDNTWELCASNHLWTDVDFSLFQCTYYARHVKKSCFPAISPSGPLSFHTTPEIFENASLFLRSFSKARFKPALRFRVDGTHFECWAFRKHGDDVTINFPEFFSNRNLKWLVIEAFFKTASVVWTKNSWCLFRVKPPLLLLVQLTGPWSRVVTKEDDEINVTPIM